MHQLSSDGKYEQPQESVVSILTINAVASWCPLEVRLMVKEEVQLFNISHHFHRL